MILRKKGKVHIEHKLYISPLEQARVLILGKYVLLGFINTVYEHCSAWMILWHAGEGSIFLDHGLYISALEHVMKLILSSYVLLVFINRINRIPRLSDSAQCRRSVNFLAWAISALTQASVLIWSKNNVLLWFKVIAKDTNNIILYSQVWFGICEEFDLHADICNVGPGFMATDYMSFLESPGTEGENMRPKHWVILKWILCYL